MDYDFLIEPDELELSYQLPAGRRALRFPGAGSADPAGWQQQAITKLTELLRVDRRAAAPMDVNRLRDTVDGDVLITALRMQVSRQLSIPGYLLHPAATPAASRTVIALHGHGGVETSLKIPGVTEDYHHNFAYRLAQAGHTVLVPELRGFGVLYNLGAHQPGSGSTYWRWGQHMTYTLATDAFQHGRTLIGDIIEDLLRWEHWLHSSLRVEDIDVAGISFGGDLALTYPIFSTMVRSIFASGTLGSFEPIFSICGNAPAHCIPGVLDWFDRADIAGLNAPRPIAVHYGALDTPSPDNGSAAYNHTVDTSISQLRDIYAATGDAEAITLLVSPDLTHEMDLPALTSWLAQQQAGP